MAVKYLSGNRLWGTDAERLAMSGADTSATPTYSNTFANDTDFSTTSTTYVNVDDTVAGALWHDVTRSATNRAGTWNLPSALSDDTWTMRFQSNMTTVSGSGATTRTFIGMTDKLYTDGSTVSQNFIGLGTKLNAAASIWYPVTVKGNHLDVGDTDSTTYALSETTIYIEVKRLTSTTYSIRWTTSSDYTGGTLKEGTVGEDGGSGTCTGLQRFVVCNLNVSTTGAYSIIGNIPEVNIWDNVLPNLPNGTIFITSDTNVHYMWNGTDTWNEVA
jgi:hypothetical protein